MELMKNDLESIIEQLNTSIKVYTKWYDDTIDKGVKDFFEGKINAFIEIRDFLCKMYQKYFM